MPRIDSVTFLQQLTAVETWLNNLSCWHYCHWCIATDACWAREQLQVYV